MMFFVFFIGYALLGIYEFVPLYKENKKKEFYVNLALGLISLVMAVLLSFKVNIPSPAELIEKVIYYILSFF